MASISQSGPGLWFCTVKQDKETGVYIAHCLNLHTKAGGKTSDEACESLAKIIKAHYEYCVEFDPEGLNLTAPIADWREYKSALVKALREDPGSIFINTLEINVKAPKLPTQVMELSCQRVAIAEHAETAAAC